MSASFQEALEAAARFVENAASGSDDENIVDLGPWWAEKIRALTPNALYDRDAEIERLVAKIQERDSEKEQD